MDNFIVCAFVFGIIAFAILLCGNLQKEKNDIYARYAVICMVVQAILIIFLYSKFIPFGALCLSHAVILITHHIIIHSNIPIGLRIQSTERGVEETTFLTLQLKDISNHETWIVALLTASIVFFVESSQSSCIEP